MLRHLWSKLVPPALRRASDAPSPDPADSGLWTRSGHTETRAREIAECFPEYWQRLGSPHPQRNARYCFARQIGDMPLHWKYPRSPNFADTEELPETDPLMWCRVKGHDLYSLEQAVEYSLLAAKKKANPKLKPQREEWWRLRWSGRYFDRKRLHFSEKRTPLNPLFWRQLGHNPAHARRLVRCCPEYWFQRSLCSWNEAARCATQTLHRIASRLHTQRALCYELAESDQYDIAKRDPAYWHLEGCDWDETLRKVIKEALKSPPEGCVRMLEVRDELRKAGRHAELLRDRAIHVRGPVLGYQPEYERVQKLRRRKSAQEPPAVAWPRWGPLELDTERAATAHCCAIGPRRQGTDTLLRILMSSVTAERWLVLDGWNELLPAIQAFRPETQIYLLNPLDARSCAWNIAEDTLNSQQAQLVAGAILPPDAHHDATLLEIARTILVQVMETLNAKAPQAWQLLHLIAALEDNNLETVLCSDPPAASLYETVATYPHFRLITAFLRSRLQPLKPVAAAWLHSSQSISVSAWAQSPCALVLSNDFAQQHVLGPLNRIVFHVAASRLLRIPPVAMGHTWVFFSDLTQIGRLDALSTLLSQGEAAGVTAVITLEDVELLQRHYGPETTGILSLCGNYAFLKMTNPVTAHWASQVIGIEKVRIIHQTTGTLSGKTSRGVTITNAERPVVPATSFQQLPMPFESRKLTGYFRNFERRVYRGHVDPPRVLGHQGLREPGPPEPNFVPRPDDQLQFPLDTAAVLAAIGFTPNRNVPLAPRRKSKTRPFSDTGGNKNAADTSQLSVHFDPDEFPRIDLPPQD